MAPGNVNFVLASSSRYRAALLRKLIPEFAVSAPDIDEHAAAGESPAQLVTRLAQAKAVAVAQRPALAANLAATTFIIGSDQVVSCDDQVLTKPGTEAVARAQLQRLSGRQFSLLTGLCLLRVSRDAGAASPQQWRSVCVARNLVRMRDLTDTEIATYVQREQPLDCAGSFKSEGLGIALFAQLDGDPNAIVGLPLIELTTLLREAGYNPLTGVFAAP